MAEKINKRIKKAAQKRAQKQEVDPRKNMPSRCSPEGFLWLLWAFILDLMGVFSALLIAVLGIGLILSFVVDALGMGTIGFYMYRKTKHMPTSKRVRRLAKRFGFTSAIELMPILGDVVFSWTVYLYIEFKEC